MVNSSHPESSFIMIIIILGYVIVMQIANLCCFINKCKTPQKKNNKQKISHLYTKIYSVVLGFWNDEEKN